MTSQKERMIAGQLYLASDPELAHDRLACRRLLHAFNTSPPDEGELRAELLAKLFASVGAGSYIEPPFFCDYGYNITLGQRFYANFQCVVLDCAPVSIGDDVFFAPGVQVYTATHPTNAPERVKGPEYARPIHIGSRVWIGGGSILLPGVSVGEGSTIGAGSVVTRDIPANVIAVGNPCRVVRSAS